MNTAIRKTITLTVIIVVAMFATLANMPSSFATTKGLSQIVTPDLEPEGDFSLSFQLQDKRIANPYQLQGELGLTQWTEVAVFRGFMPATRTKRSSAMPTTSTKGGEYRWIGKAALRTHRPLASPAMLHLISSSIPLYTSAIVPIMTSWAT